MALTLVPIPFLKVGLVDHSQCLLSDWPTFTISHPSIPQKPRSPREKSETAWTPPLRSPWMSPARCPTSLSLLPGFCAFSNLACESFLKEKTWDFPGGPVVRNPSYNAGDVGLILSRKTNIPHEDWEPQPSSHTLGCHHQDPIQPIYNQPTNILKNKRKPDHHNHLKIPPA